MASLSGTQPTYALSARVVLVIMGALLVLAASGYYASRDVEIFIPWLWPTWLLVAGMSCFAFAARFESAHWWQISRVLVVIGVLSRSFSIFLRAVNSELPSAGAGLGGACIYLIGAAALYRVWTVDFRRQSRRAAGLER